MKQQKGNCDLSCYAKVIWDSSLKKKIKLKKTILNSINTRSSRSEMKWPCAEQSSPFRSVDIATTVSEIEHDSIRGFKVTYYPKVKICSPIIFLK